MISRNKLENFSLYLYAFFINFQELKILNLDFISIPKISALLYIIIFLPNLIKVNVKSIKRFIIPIYLFFIILTTINLINLNNSGLNFIDFTMLQNIILFTFLIFHGQKDLYAIKKAVLLLCFGTFLLAVFGYFQIGTSIDEYSLGEVIGTRVTLFGDNSNIIGIRMSISIIILVSFFYHNFFFKNKLKYLFLIPLPLMVFTIAEGGSRTAFLSLFISIFAFFFLQKSRNMYQKIIMFLIFVSCLVLLYNFFIAYQFLIFRLLGTLFLGEFSGRDESLTLLLEIINNNTLFGIGQTGYETYNIGSPHNVIIEILVYTGLFGLIFYLSFLIKIFKGAINLFKRQGNITLILLLIPISGLILTGQILDSKLIWFIFAYFVTVISSKNYLNISIEKKNKN